jgi:predicted HTH domain antitoxin
MQILLDIPNSYLDVMHCGKEDFQREAKLAMAVKFFEMKRLSSGMAAALAGLDRAAFMAELPRFGVSLIDLTNEDLVEDVRNA